MKLFATGLLLFAAVVFVVARAFEDEGTWVGYVESAAEAAMVGALADWFAVTALFRYPARHSDPAHGDHPRRKDDIGRSLGDFVQGNFLTPEVIGERLAGARIAERLGHWLAQSSNAERAGRGRRRRPRRRRRGARRPRRPGGASAPRSRSGWPPPEVAPLPARRSTWPSTVAITSGCSTA